MQIKFMRSDIGFVIDLKRFTSGSKPKGTVSAVFVRILKLFRFILHVGYYRILILRISEKLFFLFLTIWLESFGFIKFRGFCNLIDSVHRL